MPASSPVLHCHAIVKHYLGLRPFRIRELHVESGERVVIGGFDVITAELFTNLVNGATLPDEGEIEVFGTPTHAVSTEAEWLTSLDRLGVVTVRAVLLDGMSVLQNLALPLSIEIDPMSPALTEQASALAQEVGLDQSWFGRPVQAADPDVRMRIQLARALALNPPLLLLEHPTASLTPEGREPYARQVADIARQRGMTVVACSQDRVFAREAATRHLQLQAGSGELVPIAV